MGPLVKWLFIPLDKKKKKRRCREKNYVHMGSKWYGSWPLSRPSEMGRKACIHTHRELGKIIPKERPERCKGKRTQRKSNIVKIKAVDTEGEVVTVVE